MYRKSTKRKRITQQRQGVRRRKAKRNDMKRASFPQQLSTLTQGNEALLVALKEL